MILINHHMTRCSSWKVIDKVWSDNFAIDLK